MAEFNHSALGLQKERPLVYTAMSKHLFYFRFFISQFVVKQGAVPLNPFLLWDYFLLDTVNRDEVREANNNIVKRADEIWVFGAVSNGVLAEIKIAQEQKKPIKFFKIGNPHKIIQVVSKNEIEMEDDVKDFKNEIKFNNKKIVICGSISATPQIKEVSDKLLEMGYETELPVYTKKILAGEITLEEFLRKKEQEGDFDFRNKANEDVIKRYYRLIKEADAILVVNIDKNGIRNYIGGNTLMEMGFAHVLEKKIFLLNDIPDISYKDEIRAMQPIMLNGDLSKIA